MREFHYTTPATISVHAGEAHSKPSGAVAEAIHCSSTYSFRNTQEILDMLAGDSHRHEYGRYSFPTQTAVEQKLAALDGGEDCILFSSGMAAVTTLLLAKLKAGDEVVIFDECYHRSREFCRSHLARFGIMAKEVATGDFTALKKAITPRTKLLISESPTNPHLTTIDLQQFVTIAKEAGVESVIDATLATPFNLKPLDYGIDYVIHSATKYLAGHNDLLAGTVVGSQEKLACIRNLRGILGPVSSAHTAYLLQRGLKTFPIRMAQHNHTGQELATFLQKHPKIERVWYPSLSQDGKDAWAQEHHNGFGGLITFTLKGNLKSTASFVDSLQIPRIAPSLGGVESLVEQPAIMSYFHLPKPEREALGIYDNMVRVSCGIEDTSDIIADFSESLEAVG